jgi:hypothetical protein
MISSSSSPLAASAPAENTSMPVIFSRVDTGGWTKRASARPASCPAQAAA